jgi:hypothetical protein
MMTWTQVALLIGIAIAVVAGGVAIVVTAENGLKKSKGRWGALVVVFAVAYMACVGIHSSAKLQRYADACRSDCFPADYLFSPDGCACVSRWAPSRENEP